MKGLFGFLARGAGVALAALSLCAVAAVAATQYPTGGPVGESVGSIVQDCVTGSLAAPCAATSSALNLTASTVVKASAGRLARIDVVVAGSAAGAAYDSATTGAAGSSNEIFAIPNTVGTYYLDWPCANGIVVTPGTGQTLAVSYE